MEWESEHLIFSLIGISDGDFKSAFLILYYPELYLFHNYTVLHGTVLVPPATSLFPWDIAHKAPQQFLKQAYSLLSNNNSKVTVLE